MAPPLTTLIPISVLIEQLSDIPEPEDVASEDNLYFEVLELQPIRLSLSFERTDRVSGEEKYVIA
jgi:vacuolar protein sorting-associated protein 13A/C